MARRLIAQTLVKITLLLDEHAEYEQEQAMVFLNARYPSRVGVMADALEERRRADRERQELSRDMSRAVRDDPNPLVASTSTSSSSEFEEALKQKRFEKAKTLIKAEDLEFLQACPEPMKSQWIGDGEWWLSLRDGYPKINAQEQASRYMAWPGSRRKRDHRAALRNWIAKADRWRENEEMRKAVRR